MAKDYQKDIYRQLAELMLKHDSLIPEDCNTPVTYGPTLKTIIVDLYGEGAMSVARIQDFINSISKGTSISEGCVYNALKQFDKKIQPSFAGKITQRISCLY